MTVVDKQEVIRTRQENSGASLVEIGGRFGISRERVRQILKQAGMPTRAYYPPRPSYSCNYCGKEIKKGLHCNRQCRHNACNVKIACCECGNLKEYNTRRLIRGIAHGLHSTELFFCTKKCQGAWQGKQHGFKKKWDYSQIFELRDAKGWSAVRIGRDLGIPSSTIVKILHKRNT